MNHEAEVLSTDIAIVGTGLVGLSAAVALHHAGFLVQLVDSQNPLQCDAADEAWDSRIYAISPNNAHWLASLGVWDSLNAKRVGTIQAMEIHGDNNAAPLLLAAEDAHADQLGFIVEARALQQALLTRVVALGIPTMRDTRCTDIKSSAKKASLSVTNQLHSNQLIEAQLLLAADGGQSWVRQHMGMVSAQTSYQQVAVVANFRVERSHANIARQWFSCAENGDTSILAWLPLPENTISIVWSVSSAYAAMLLDLSEEDFTRCVVMAGGCCLGDFKLLAKPSTFPLSLQKTAALNQDCVLLVGDAAHQVHPMAGQGVNLGFRDVIDLVKILTEKNQYQAVNDSSLLRKYTRLRKADMIQVLLLTDGLYKLFSSQYPMVKKVRNWGWSMTRHSTIKKMLVASAIAL
jgi:ubiquinone biosynthesis UbiH/UbiF/VisC/COQ6 family hydroxylase